MKLDTEYIFCNLSILATESEFSQFIDKTSLREGSICVFNLGDNSLFEGFLAPKHPNVGNSGNHAGGLV